MVVFPFKKSFNLKDSAIRKAIRIILEDFKNHPSKESLEEKLREIGVYSTELKIEIHQHFGYFYILLYLNNSDQLLESLKILKERIEYFKKSNILSKVVQESLKDIKNNEILNIQDKESLLNKVIDSFLLSDKFKSVKSILRVYSFKTSFFKVLFNKLFNIKNSQVLVFYGKEKPVSKKQVQKILFNI